MQREPAGLTAAGFLLLLKGARPAPAPAGIASRSPSAPSFGPGGSPPAAPGGTKRVAPAALDAVFAALALLALALIDDAGRAGASDTGTLFWLPLLALALPAGFVLLGSRAGGGERLAVLLVLGAALYLVKLLLSPAEFTFSDELSTLRTTQDLARTGHLLTPNTIAVAFSLYPGADLSALSVSQAGATSLFSAGVLLIGAAKLVIVIGVYRLLDLAGRSQRVASLGALVYMANPNFLFFDAQFSYESLALPLAVAVLVLVGVALERPDRRSRSAIAALAAVIACGLAPTHHITSYALLVVLACWAAGLSIGRRRGLRWPAPGPLLAVLAAAAAAVAGWLVVVGRATSGYLRPVVGGAVESTYDFLSGSGSGKTLFHSSGETNSSLEQVLGLGSVLLLLGLLALALWRLRRERPPSALAWVLTAMAALYPASLALRLTQAGSETSNRASEFLFLGLALLAGGVLAHEHPFPTRARALASRMLLTAAVGLLFAGGAVIGWPPASRVPGRPLIEADARSVEPYDLAAARWAARHLVPGSLMVADRANGLLMSAYARQEVLIGAVDQLPFGSVITSPFWGRTQQKLVYGVGISYIVLDRRLAGRFPALGVYVDHDEPEANAHRTPLSPQAIAKFARVPGMVRVYDNGEVEIYEVHRPVRRRGR